eukprot:GHVP01057635.1.p1 GENE.GHVP01057635.1~~GHVP01057635.1.p1  ORF type:complete len:157 (+),score=21.87 GHVP01057635.1:105-575(+)
MPQKRSEDSQDPDSISQEVKDEPSTSENKSTTTKTYPKANLKLKLVYSDLGEEETKDLREKLSDCFTKKDLSEYQKNRGYSSYADVLFDFTAITIHVINDQYAFVDLEAGKQADVEAGKKADVQSFFSKKQFSDASFSAVFNFLKENENSFKNARL